MLGFLVAVASCGDPAVGALRSEPMTAAPEAQSGTASDAGSGVPPVSFARDIRPLMSRGDAGPHGCMRCHYRSGQDPQGIELGGLDLTTLGDLRKGGVSSKQSIVVPGNPEASALLLKLQGRYPRGARMPKDRAPWSEAEIALVRRWIAEGARGTDDQ